MWETYSAFANTQGGDIFLGLKESADGSFTLAGIKNTQKVLYQLWTTLNNPEKVSANILREQWVKVVSIGDTQILHIHVPRASRLTQPLYINNNPLTGTYQRFGSTDKHVSEEMVRRMLAEQVCDSRDSAILKGFTLDDLNLESIQIYRNMLSAHKTGHPWVTLYDQIFLEKLGCWRKDRESQEEGYTIAALLMFGDNRPINEALPNYFVDYQEHGQDTSEMRWLDRVVPDGTWSGNVFDFHRRVIRKLEEDIKVPFTIQDNVRIDDTPLHQSLREALINCLVHADYSDRASVKVVKSPCGFYFRNPGIMRVPAEVALEGGESDCRNRTLHKLFLLLGLGEQAGSGLPKIRQGWVQAGHELLLTDSYTPYNMTEMRLNWESSNDGVNLAVSMDQQDHQILTYIKANPGITQLDLVEQTGKSKSTIERRMQKLKKLGVLRRVGVDKTGHWEVVE